MRNWRPSDNHWTLGRPPPKLDPDYQSAKSFPPRLRLAFSTRRVIPPHSATYVSKLLFVLKLISAPDLWQKIAWFPRRANRMQPDL